MKTQKATLNREQELEKGCGKKFNVKKFRKGSMQRQVGILYEADNCLFGGLCPECKAELKGFKQGQLEERKRILEILERNRFAMPLGLLKAQIQGGKE